jgi:hypothetical protein
VQLSAALCKLRDALCGGNFMPEADHARWLTYRELEATLGVEPNAARMHAHRRGLPKRASNVDERTRVLVPESTVLRDRAMHREPAFDAPSNGPVQAHTDPHIKANVQAHIQAHGLSPELIERAVETLCDMVGWSSRRLEELEKRLADAVAAERIAANEAAGLRAELDRLRMLRVPWWRRWLR